MITRQITSSYDIHSEVIKKTLEELRANAIGHSFDYHNLSKRRFDDNHLELTFDIDNQVLIRVKSRSSKLGDKFEGPYRVVSRKHDISELENIANTTDKRRRHIPQMKLFSSIPQLAT